MQNSLPTLGNRPYYSGSNAPRIVESGLLGFIVGDVAKNAIVSNQHYYSDQQAMAFISEYVRENSVKTAMVIFADYGDEQPLIVQSTF